MDNSIQQCLNLIIEDNVDEVLRALSDTYIWLVRKYFADETYKNNNVLQRFLDQISQNLVQKEYRRRIITDKEVNVTFRNSEAIGKIIQQSVETLALEQRIDFLGKLTAIYALEVPEPLFRAAKSFTGLHQTADILPINDSLPMTDEMILF